MKASLRISAQIITATIWVTVIICGYALLDRLPVFAIVCGGLALCLVAANIFLGFKTITIDWDKLRQSPEIRTMLGITLAHVGTLAFFVWLIEQDHSKFSASFFTSVFLIVLFIASVLSMSMGDEKSSDSFERGLMHGALSAFLPVALIASGLAVAMLVKAFLYLEFTGNIEIFFKGLVGLVWLLVALGMLAVGIVGIENDARRYDFPKSRTNWLLFIIIVAMCGVLGQLSYHTWSILWHGCYVASLIGGGIIIWDTKIIKIAGGEDEIPNSAFFGGFACWVLSMVSMINIVGDKETLANVSLITLLWPAVMISVWLARQYSGWKKSPTT